MSAAPPDTEVDTPPETEAPAPARCSPLPPREQAKPRGTRRSPVDVAVLALIGVVVVLVSLPKLRRFALHENESDAIRAVRMLGDVALDHEDLFTAGRLAALVDAVPGRRAHLEDLETLPDGKLRRHGYVFEWIEGMEGGTAIVAWPWEHGRTGVAVFAVVPGGPVLGLANADGRYGGTRRPPPPPRAGDAGADDVLAWTPLASDG
jgi:hypothetical protein